MQSVAVIDYGMGNLHSVTRALRHEAPPGTHVLLTDDLSVIGEADRLVFPGQGAAADAMLALRRLGIDRMLPELAATRPFLGMCLGQQILLDWSAENGGVDLLGLIPGRVERFPERAIDHEGRRLKIPHMGWNVVRRVREHPLWQGLPREAWFYFVHSYRVLPAQGDQIVGETDYGDTFASAIADGPMFAMQCHPEKSAADGLRLLNNFLRWDGGW
ncbi:imidazole glycerol phosphate synthase subunit HisH [Thioalkalivibrio paradoxus]|uniref:Imidazole glycerol phosphate synthase subunit HisH n=1 Tax=Thioalkalivibrio paradoxus ARh 1 TaxID=713585 RepID=W0DIB2_9GAMM|nr:imidazole glycerol phosphate synthase subunit HisH [Thioalkalivibrio paradoxus]AHE96997.1 imidazole glycerol phosphate synthase [Thioalkalivibrio paradoxus ARh 1]